MVRDARAGTLRRVNILLRHLRLHGGAARFQPVLAVRREHPNRARASGAPSRRRVHGRRMWGRAVRRRLLATAPRPGCPPQTPFSWNASEVGAFDAAMKGDRLFALLLSVMGLRPAGVCCLRWSDIDLDAATLSIANTRTMMRRRTVVGKDTKSMAGERMLPLPSLVREALKRFRATQAVGEGYECGGYALVDELGCALKGRQLRTWAYKVLDANGLRGSVCTMLGRLASRTSPTTGCRITCSPGGEWRRCCLRGWSAGHRPLGKGPRHRARQPDTPRRKPLPPPDKEQATGLAAELPTKARPHHLDQLPEPRRAAPGEACARCVRGLVPGAPCSPGTRRWVRYARNMADTAAATAVEANGKSPLPVS